MGGRPRPFLGVAGVGVGVGGERAAVTATVASAPVAPAAPAALATPAGHSEPDSKFSLAGPISLLVEVFRLRVLPLFFFGVVGEASTASSLPSCLEYNDIDKLLSSLYDQSSLVSASGGNGQCVEPSLTGLYASGPLSPSSVADVVLLRGLLPLLGVDGEGCVSRTGSAEVSGSGIFRELL